MPRLKREHIRDSLPQYDLSDGEVDMAIDRTRAWIADAKEIDRLPDDLGDGDWADAVEIAIMVVTNPEAFAQKQVGATGRMWPIILRRDDVLKRVRARAQRGSTGPRGSYPAPPAWPEPASPQRALGGPGGYAQPETVWIVR